MSPLLSPNTQAILLLTAPLMVGRSETSSEILRPSEYKRVAGRLIQIDRLPSDLIGPDAEELFPDLEETIEIDRLQRLLARGFQLSQAIERWQARSIWVAGVTDDSYPKRIRQRLNAHAPPVIYGCGDAGLLDSGGLAVVGSREVDEQLVEFTLAVGRLAAEANQTLVSGGARGIDQASMRGALEAGGKAVGVMADSLERAAMNREHRELLMEDRLVLISPYDPSAGFNVGHAMQRNKLIYALADAALVVNSDYEKGGTWAGAIEQLEKLHFVPVYVRNEGNAGASTKALDALQKKGALAWPNQMNADELGELLNAPVVPKEAEQMSFL